MQGRSGRFPDRSRRHAQDRFRIGLIIVVRVAVVEVHVPRIARIIGLRGRGPRLTK